MWKLYKSKGFTSFLLPVAIVVTLSVQISMLKYYPSWSVVLIPIVAIVVAIPTVLLFAFKLMHKYLTGKVIIACVTIGIFGLLIIPAVWSYTPNMSGYSAQMPSAGSSSDNMSTFMQNGQVNRSNQDNLINQSGSANRLSGKYGLGSENNSDTKLIDFLVKNNTGEKFLVAVSNASAAEPIILATGKPVMAIGGFSGNDKTLTVAKLEQMVKAGEIKYYMVGGGMGGGDANSSDNLTAWVEANGKAVDQSELSSTTTTVTGNMRQLGMPETLYDLSSYKSNK
jgi:4-amino-4-deoxy-L-arabinose transferase-like glycosyltransferase